MFVREKIKNLLQKAVKSAEDQETVLHPGIPVISLKPTEGNAFGDYVTTIPFQLAKAWGMDPIMAGELVAKELWKLDPQKKIFKKIDVIRGFLNLTLQDEVFKKELAAILNTKAKYGRGGKKKEKINIEFISANPTGPLTMANGRGGFLGDVLANILEKAGYKVKREYYVNDAGNQIRTLGFSILNKKKLISDKINNLNGIGNYYSGHYIEKLSDKISLEDRFKESYKNLQNKIDEQLEESEGIKKSHRTSNVQNAQDWKKITDNKSLYNLNVFVENFSREKLIPILIKLIKDSLNNVDIHFDYWFSEYENLHKKGKIKKTRELLEKKGLAMHHDGAVWLASSDIADEKDRVLVKSDGQPTYFLADLAYHYDKFIYRKFDTAITIWGADHHGYIARLKAGVKAIGIDPERLKIIITQLVRLVKNGQEVKMSKRAGEFVTLDELVSEVGVDAARFFFLMHAPNTHMDFDLELAKEKSSKNPVYYVQYSYARIASILRADKEGKKNLYPEKKEDRKEQDALVKKLAQFPEVIEDTAGDFHTLRLTNYALELARAFHHFYETHPILIADKKLRAERLKVVQAVKIILKNTFDILGISAPEKM